MAKTLICNIKEGYKVQTTTRL